MAFQTGAATGAVDLLNQFRTWMLAGGAWASVADVAEGTGRRIAMSKGGLNVLLRSFDGVETATHNVSLGGGGTIAGVAVAMSTAYSGASANMFTQTGVPVVSAQNVTCVMSLVPATAIGQYWFFADATWDNIVVVVLRAAGIYTHFHFGTSIEKADGTAAGGRYYGAARGRSWQTHVSSSTYGSGVFGSTLAPGALIGTTSSQDATLVVQTDAVGVGGFGFLGTLTAYFGNALFRLMRSSARYHTSDVAYSTPGEDTTHPNFWRISGFSALQSAAAILLPVILYIDAVTAGGEQWSHLGRLPNIFQAQTEGYLPGNDHVISTETYTLFPNFAVRKFP